MDTKTETQNPAEDGGVVALLKKHKASNTGENETTLPETGITVTWPKFQPHGTWMKAQRVAKKNPYSVADIYIALLCKFNGERLTIEEFKTLVPNGDALHLTGEVLGGDDEDEEGDAGNA